MSRRDRRGKKVAVIGVGNTGSHVTSHLARMPEVGEVTLVDRDVYDETNLATQNILRRDIGRPKAHVRARRLREIAPDLRIEAFATAVEEVPLGALRADVWLGCVDSAAARCAINARAWRLGIPWIDTAVHGEELLARVNVWRPAAEEPCHECSYGDADYDALEREYPCAGDGTPASTNAPSALGALAASMQALQCRKVLLGEWEEVVVGRQVTVNARWQQMRVTSFRRNPRCRFDHQIWALRPLGLAPDTFTLDDVLDVGRRALATDAEVRVKLADHAFAAKLRCPACGVERALMPYPMPRIGPSARRCDACGGPMRPAGVDLQEWLGAELPSMVRGAALATLGIRPGDVLEVAGSGRAVHFEIEGRTRS